MTGKTKKKKKKTGRTYVQRPGYYAIAFDTADDDEVTPLLSLECGALDMDIEWQGLTITSREHASPKDVRILWDVRDFTTMVCEEEVLVSAYIGA